MPAYTIEGWNKSPTFTDLGFKPQCHIKSDFDGPNLDATDVRYVGNFVSRDGLTSIWDPSDIPDFVSGVEMLMIKQVIFILYVDTSGDLQLRTYLPQTQTLSDASLIVSSGFANAQMGSVEVDYDAPFATQIWYSVAKVVYRTSAVATALGVITLGGANTIVATTSAACTPTISRPLTHYMSDAYIVVYAGDLVDHDGVQEHIYNLNGTLMISGVKDAAALYEGVWNSNYTDLYEFTASPITIANAWKEADLSTDVTGSATYKCYAVSRGPTTYFYATKPDVDATLIVYRGRYTGGTMVWEAFYAHDTATLVGIHAISRYMGGPIIAIELDIAGAHYLYTYGILNIVLSGCQIKRALQKVPSKAYLSGKNLNVLEQNLGRQVIYDSNNVARFEGYLLPSNDKYSAVLESVDRVLANPVNESFTAQTSHQLIDSIGAEAPITVGTNNLDAAQTYTQEWGKSMAKKQALSTIVAWDTAYWRSKVNTIDVYKLSAGNSSGKTITFGTTSAQLVSKKPSVSRPVNKITVIGGYASSGILQKTLEDTNDQAVSGVNPLTVRRSDLHQAEAVVNYCTELWARRSVVQNLPYIYTVILRGRVWLDVGDTIVIADANKVSDSMIDGTYFILSNAVDLITGTSVLELSTSIAGAQTTFSDTLPEVIQVPVIDADNTTGTAVETVSLADVIAGKLPLLRLEESSDPADPESGKSLLWLDTDGDLHIKINHGGSTKDITLVDWSAA